MAKINTQNTITSRKQISALRIFVGFLVVALLSFGVLAGIGLLKSKNDESDNSPKAEQVVAKMDSESDSEQPKTDDKKTTAGNENKAKNDELEKERQKEVEKNENGLKKAIVQLNEPYTDDGKTIISSVITNVVELEGACNYVFTNGSYSITKTTQVLPNAKNTVCEAIVLEKGDLNTGEWKVKLEYKSNTSEGVSETQTFTIQ